ncbi:MAG: hypothetical protein A2293_09975 [Elusimicrobia bacterium RIFOXYB2_FULL_49_7]|nr:MAG: hypothetical protein A2293_09975 [Elusimicrobia bacterium RIFOXYB2_FULL_49_7]
MRKSFDGLCGEVRNHLGQDPVSGDYFVFVNRKSDLMKILVFDRHGFWVLAKRLEAGRFRVPSSSEGAGNGLLLPFEELLCMIEGIDTSSVRRLRRFSLSSKRKDLTNSVGSAIIASSPDAYFATSTTGRPSPVKEGFFQSHRTWLIISRTL